MDLMLNIAHRGASGHAPENTMAAFELALDMGADGVELDVQLTADGYVIVFHDEKLERTTNMKGRLIDHTLHDLRQADAGSWFGLAFKNEKIPLLREVIDLARNKMILNIEIKIHDEMDLSVVPTLLSQLKDGKARDVILTSFSAPALEQVRELDRKIPLGLLTSVPVSKPGKYEYICPRYTMLTAKRHREFQKAGYDILAWTVNEKEDMRAMLNMKMAGIITNYPDRLKKMQQELKFT